jgi:hypothetical protein
MTDSTSGPSYGGRFFDELQRLAKSTSGFNYSDIQRVHAMDREQVIALLPKVYDLDSILRLDSSSPEEFARAIVRERVARAADPATDAALLSTLLDFLPLI